MGRSIPAKLAAAAVVVAASLSFVSSATAVSVGSFSVSPATFNPAVPSTRAYFQPVIRPGARFSGRVVVSNAGARAVTLRVYPVAGLTAVTSGAVYANRRLHATRAGRWVTPAVQVIRVPARSRLKVRFVVKVPVGTSPGDHLAGLAFQDTRPHRSGGKFSITEIIRAVVGIEVKVPGPARAQIQLRGAHLSALPGTEIPAVVVRLEDAGRLLCKPRLTVRVAGAGGSSQVTRRLDTILPGDVIPYPFLWPRVLSAGPYVAQVTATGCGQSRQLTANMRLGRRLAGTAADPRPRHPAPPSGGGVGLGVLLLVGLGGLAVGVGTRLRLGRGGRVRGGVSRAG